MLLVSNKHCFCDGVLLASRIVHLLRSNWWSLPQSTPGLVFVDNTDDLQRDLMSQNVVYLVLTLPVELLHVQSLRFGC